MQQGKATKNKTPANALNDAMMVTEPDVGEDRKSPSLHLQMYSHSWNPHQFHLVPDVFPQSPHALEDSPV